MDHRYALTERNRAPVRGRGRHDCQCHAHHFKDGSHRPSCPCSWRRTSINCLGLWLQITISSTLEPFKGILSDGAKRLASWLPRLDTRVHLDKKEDKDTRPNENSSFYPQSTGHKNESQEDGLDGQQRSEPAKQPNLEQPSCLRVGTCIDVTDEETVG